MKTITEITLKKVVATRKKFFQEVGVDPDSDKKKFINWYFENHTGNFDMIISDLSEYYLFISESRILRILNEK